jgi:hypothetical protein
MKKLFALVALLSAPAAAQQATVFYASDTWPVTAAGQSCTMAFAGPDAIADPLSVSYDGREVALTTANEVAASLPASGTIDLAIVFLDNGRTAYDDGWGTRRFTYSRDNGKARFTARFSGERNVRQMLADLENSNHIGFLHRGKAVMSADLADARRSLARLRECGARVVAAN